MKIDLQKLPNDISNHIIDLVGLIWFKVNYYNFKIYKLCKLIKI